MNDKYDLMSPLAGPDGHINVARTNGMGFDRGRAVITSANKKILN
ncbi:hypothetical protein GCM10020331_102770 [Ectobacillus funiculus]